MPVCVFNQIGNMQAQATRLIFPMSFMPNITSINGISATGGIERKK